LTKIIDPQKREWLKDLRTKKNLKVREMAEIFGISHQHYSDIENGRRNPSIELSKLMAKFFNVRIELFLADRTKFARGEAQ
jgi:transcriptional regulator with XRE-family HTH domain